MRSSPQTGSSIRVEAPARLHLGFLDLNGDLGRKFGSIGLAVDQPSTALTISRATKTMASGVEHDRVFRLTNKFLQEYAADSRYAVHVESAIPAHAGLGSGTQLALAIGAGIARLEGRHLTPDALAELGDRGARSGIGLAAFVDGGFIIDGGKGDTPAPPPLTLRADFPTDWRVILVVQEGGAGVSGDAELTAFAGLPDFPANAAAHICRLVLMKLLPGLKELNIGAFGAAITEIQEIVGGHFASKQGGSMWTSPAVGRIVSRMRELGATGVGQSSWGPTGFAFVESEKAAVRLYHSLVEAAKGDGLNILIAKGRNTGASIEVQRA